MKEWPMILIRLFVMGNVLSTGMLCILYDVWCYQEHIIKCDAITNTYQPEIQSLILMVTVSLSLDMLLVII